jgi:hypothetical protein
MADQEPTDPDPVDTRHGVIREHEELKLLALQIEGMRLDNIDKAKPFYKKPNSVIPWVVAFFSVCGGTIGLCLQYNSYEAKTAHAEAKAAHAEAKAALAEATLIKHQNALKAVDDALAQRTNLLNAQTAQSMALDEANSAKQRMVDARDQYLTSTTAEAAAMSNALGDLNKHITEQDRILLTCSG